MFLTPEGQPFWGGTYFPKTARAGMAAFTDICREIARLYYEENEKVQNNAGQLTNALKTRQSAALKAPAQPNFINQAAESLSKYLDEENGGMQGQPKFPQAFVFQFLWETAIAQQNPALQNLMHHTAQQISSGGIYDHLGVGLRVIVLMRFGACRILKKCFMTMLCLLIFSRCFGATSHSQSIATA